MISVTVPEQYYFSYQFWEIPFNKMEHYHTSGMLMLNRGRGSSVGAIKVLTFDALP